MEFFELEDKGIKEIVTGAEKVASFLVLLLSAILLLSFMSVENIFNWRMFVLGVVLTWIAAEAVTFVVRRVRIRRWNNYKIGYKNESIVEFRRGEKYIELFRDNIQQIKTTDFGLVVESLEGIITIPNQIEGYEDLVVRLRNWKAFEESRIEVQKESQFESRASYPHRNHHSIPIQRRPKPSYQETRMREVRQARRRRKFVSFIEFLGRKRQ